MRKHLRLVALIIPMVLVASNSYAAVKAGSSCSKAGIKSVSAGKTFTCVKIGKKLVWNKGVFIPVAKPLPAPTASPSAATTASPVPQEEPKENSKAERYEVVSIDDLKAKNVYDRSRQEIYDAIEKSNYVNTFLNFNIGPNQIPAAVSTEKDSINKAAKLWSNIYQPKEQLEVLFYNFTDLDWAKNKYKQISGAETFYSASSCSRSYCGNASAGRTGNGPWVYEQGLGGTLWNRSTSAHEYTHLAQTSGNADYWNIAPLWMVEGMAQFYGEAVGYFPFDSNLKTRGEMHRQFAGDYKGINQGEVKVLLGKNDPSSVKTLMQSIEFPNPRHSQSLTGASYLFGSYATEVLVAVYGHSSIEKFIKSFANSTDWKVNFNKSFGITVDDFYIKLTPYLYEMSKEL